MIYVTGPTSFIGRRVAPRLTKHFKQKDILCLCWNKDDKVGQENRILLEKEKFPIRYVDLVTKEGLKNLPKSPEIVIHMAANTDTSSSNHKVNDMGTKNLIRSLGKLGPKSHIIYTSTTTFLGGRKDCSLPLTEESPEYPTNEYGRSKLRAEKWLIKECKKQKFSLTILRLNTVYGPNSRPKSMFKLLPEQVKKHSLFTRLNWPGLTSIVHVEDVAKTIVYLAGVKPPKPGKPSMYILSGESLTMKQISFFMHKALKVPYRPIDLPQIIWKTAKTVRPFLPKLEKILPEYLYNPFWRASLIVDNALWCETDKIKQVYKGWKPLFLKDVAKSL